MRRHYRSGICLWAAVLLAMLKLPYGVAAIEGTYTETDTDIERTTLGAQLDSAGSVYRNIPADRKMKKIVSNVVKAEESVDYMHRLQEELREEIKQQFKETNHRVAVLEGQVQALKTLMIQSGVVKRKPGSDKTAATATTTATSLTATIQ